MKRIINMLAGGENATPLKKGVVYAALGTFVALILSIAILVGSSIALTIADNTGTEPDGGEIGGDNGGAVVKPVEFTTLESISALEEKTDSTTVSLQKIRTAMPEAEQTENVKRYYDAWENDNKVSADAQKAMDSLLVEYYKKNKDNDIAVFSSDVMTIAVIKSDAEDPADCTPITAATHSWIFANAYSYGFIYSENKFQYVGKELATYLRTSNDLTTIKAKTADKAQSLSGGYYAYYVAADATEIKVPKSLNYNVIADGSNGYIVIYKK